MIDVELNSNGKYGGLLKINGMAIPVEIVTIDQIVGDTPTVRVTLPAKVSVKVKTSSIEFMLSDGKIARFEGAEMRIVDPLEEPESL